MRCVAQCVHAARVDVDGQTVGQIGAGLLAYIGAAAGDGPSDVAYAAEKLLGLRVFVDAEGKMNRSVVDIGGGILAVSAFTTMADARKGRRPSLDAAAEPASAQGLFDSVVDQLRAGGVTVATGRFGAHMDVQSVNDGPICILLDSRRLF